MSENENVLNFHISIDGLGAEESQLEIVWKASLT